MRAKLRDPVSALTHLAGAALSIAGLVLLILAAVKYATVRHIVSFSIFGASLVLLYTASTLYHSLRLSDRGIRMLRKLDHMMIYVLIAGTYTPLCLVALKGAWRWTVLGCIWGLAVAGIVMKGLRFAMPRWFSTALYLVMGWFALVAIVPLARVLPGAAIAWLAVGGLSYSLGAVIYGLKRPNLRPGFGFHEIFHLFVLTGSLSHFWMVFRYLTRL